MNSVNNYLSGQYAPVSDERTDRDLKVIGHLPDGLAGTFLRNGPNPQFAPVGKYHLFDGDGMIHGVTFDGEGGAHYRNRFVESKGLLAERTAGHAVYGGLSEFTMPPDDIAASAGFMKNTANTNVVRHAERIFALMEAGVPTELAPDLSTIGEFTFDGRLAGPMTAHPHVDPTTGEMCFFGYSLFPPFLRYHVIAADGQLDRTVEIDVGRSTMMHDFVITDRHVIFFDLPALFDIDRLMAGEGGVYWDGAAGARIGVMPRDGGTDDVTWIEVDPFYVFHFMSAQERPDGTIEVIGCRSSQLPISFGDDAEPPADATPTLHRWIIDVANATVRTERLDDRGGDFPRINESFTGLPHRYGYVATAATGGPDGIAFDGVVKWDLESNTEQHHSYGESALAGEAVFAPDPARDKEDGGWLLNFVTDSASQETSLVVLDAADLAAGSVCEVQLPRRVPFGFHGNWMAGLLPG